MRIIFAKEEYTLEKESASDENKNNIETMMAEDYLAIGKFEKAMDIYERMGKEIPKAKLEECGKSSLMSGNIEISLRAFKMAQTDGDVIKLMFIDRALELLNGDFSSDIVKAKEILDAVSVNAIDNNAVKNRILAIIRKMIEERNSSSFVLEISKMFEVNAFKDDIIELAKWNIKKGNGKAREGGFAVLEELGAENDFRDIAKYSLEFEPPKEKMARMAYEAIFRIDKNKHGN